MKSNSPSVSLKIAVIGLLALIVVLFVYSLQLEYNFSLPSVETGGSVSLFAIFLTGLLTGGLTCMAVQGGLLAATLVQRAESAVKSKSKNKDNVLPILSFLGSKIVSYSLLGLLLGWMGSFLTMSLTVQAILQIIVAVFLLGTAANMLNLHPVFRYFVIQPPRFITRFVRKQSKKDDLFAPIILGGFTIFIPCGTTQAMMALAIASGNPLIGAAILASFTIGTSPVFFLLGYFTTKLSQSLHSKFIKFAAVAIAFLAIFNLNNAFALAGVNINPFNNISGEGSQNQVRDRINISIKDTGYTPNSFSAKRGSTITLDIFNDGAYGCAAAFAIPYYNYQKFIRVGDKDSITITLPNENTQIPFMCTMGMYRGVIQVI